MLSLHHIDFTPELLLSTSRAGGPGGQHVNKVETSVTLRFDLNATSLLSTEQLERVRTRLASRINKDGILRMVVRRHRSQAANRKLAIERFYDLLEEALAEEKPRKATAVPKAVIRKRLEDKRRQSERKRNRRGPDPGELPG